MDGSTLVLFSYEVITLLCGMLAGISENGQCASCIYMRKKTAPQGRFVSTEEPLAQASIDFFSLPIAFFSSCLMRSAETS